MMIANRAIQPKKVVLPWWNKIHCPFPFPLEIPVEWTHFLPPLVNRITHELERYYIKHACWKHHHSAVSTKPTLFVKLSNLQNSCTKCLTIVFMVHTDISPAISLNLARLCFVIITTLSSTPFTIVFFLYWSLGFKLQLSSCSTN